MRNGSCPTDTSPQGTWGFTEGGAESFEQNIREKNPFETTGSQNLGNFVSYGCAIRTEKTCELRRSLRMPEGNSGWRSEMKKTADLVRIFSVTSRMGTPSDERGGSEAKSSRSAAAKRRMSACESVGFNTRMRSPAYAMAQARLPDHTALAETSSKTDIAASKRVFHASQKPMGAETSMTHQTGISLSGTKVFTSVFPLRRLAFQSIARASSVSEYERSPPNSIPSPENTEACFPEESDAALRNLERLRKRMSDMGDICGWEEFRNGGYRTTESPIFNPWRTTFPDGETRQTASTHPFARADSTGRPVPSSMKSLSAE